MITDKNSSVLNRPKMINSNGEIVNETDKVMAVQLDYYENYSATKELRVICEVGVDDGILFKDSPVSSN